MTDEIPQWAKERAYALCYADQRRFDDPGSFMLSRVATAFARYIAEHEQPPVDPLLIEARRVVAEERYETDAFGRAVLAGHYDGHPQVQRALACLRRGIELGKGANND